MDQCYTCLWTVLMPFHLTPSHVHDFLTWNRYVCTCWIVHIIDVLDAFHICFTWFEHDNWWCLMMIVFVAVHNWVIGACLLELFIYLFCLNLILHDLHVSKDHMLHYYMFVVMVCLDNMKWIDYMLCFIMFVVHSNISYVALFSHLILQLHVVIDVFLYVVYAFYTSFACWISVVKCCLIHMDESIVVFLFVSCNSCCLHCLLSI